MPPHAEVEPWGWSVFGLAPQGMSEQHVIPHNDLQPHLLDVRCNCNPVESDDIPDMWLHQSFDGRERYERGFPLN